MCSGYPTLYVVIQFSMLWRAFARSGRGAAFYAPRTFFSY